MAKYKRDKEVLARNKSVSIGIDVHKASWFVTILVEGNVVFRGNIESFYGHLRRLFDRLIDCTITVAYEAGCCGFDLYDRLENDDIRCLVVPPSLIEASPGQRVKSDKLDSLKLAKDLADGRLPSIFVLAPKRRADRELIRTRRQVSNHISDLRRQIKSKLLFHGIRVPGGKNWSKKYIATLRNLLYPFASLRDSILALLDLLAHLSAQLATLNAKVKELSKTEDYSRQTDLLRTIPGIGILTAMTVVTELGEMSRFKDSDHLASFLGLTPSESSSGPKVHRGHITRSGNARVRTALVESSWTLIRRDAGMRRKHKELAIRIGSKRAIVAIARILSGRIRHMLLNNERYLYAA